MYERFTSRARKVFQLANQEAKRLNHEFIGAEHILLGLIKEEGRVAGNILKDLGVDPERVQQEVEDLISKWPFGRAKSAVEYAMSEAQLLKHKVVGPEHLFLGLLHERDGIAASVLTGFGITLEAARVEVLNNTQ